MTASPRARDLVERLKAWRSLLASNHYQEKVELLDSVIATLEASATAPKGEAVALYKCPVCGGTGKIDAMVAEVGAHVMPREWLDEYGFKYCCMPVGDEPYDTEFFTSLSDAQQCAFDIAEHSECPVSRVR